MAPVSITVFNFIISKVQRVFFSEGSRCLIGRVWTVRSAAFSRVRQNILKYVIIFTGVLIVLTFYWLKSYLAFGEYLLFCNLSNSCCFSILGISARCRCLSNLSDSIPYPTQTGPLVHKKKT